MKQDTRKLALQNALSNLKNRATEFFTSQGMTPNQIGASARSMQSNLQHTVKDVPMVLNTARMWGEGLANRGTEQKNRGIAQTSLREMRPLQFAQGLFNTPVGQAQELAGNLISGTAAGAQRLSMPFKTVEAFRNAPMATWQSMGDFNNPSKASIALDVFGMGFDAQDLYKAGMRGQIDNQARGVVKGIAPMKKVKADDVLPLRKRILELAEMAQIRFRKSPTEIDFDAMADVDQYHRMIFGADNTLIHKTAEQKVDDLLEALNGFTLEKTMADEGITMGITDTSLRKNVAKGSFTNDPMVDNPLLFKGKEPTEKLTRIDDVARKIEEAEVSANAGGGRGPSSFVDSLRNSFEDWVNKRRSGQVAGYAKRVDFEDLKLKGSKGITDFQAGVKDPAFAPLRKFFDDRYKDVTDAGIPMNYEKDYLTQIWANKPEEVEQILGKSLGLKPGFTMEKVIESYQKGIEAGLTPKFTNLAEIAGWYEQRVTKALADKEFFDTMVNNGYILPKSKAPQDWVSINPDGFPSYKVMTDSGEYVGTYKAPANLANTINNYLDNKENALTRFADFASRSKNIVLTGGIPGTGWNAHGINILMRNVLASKNPVSGLWTGVKYLSHPKAAQNALESNLKLAKTGVESGLTLSGEKPFQEIINNTLIDQLGGQYSKYQQQLFESPLFDKALPALKLNQWKSLTDDLAKTMPLKEARKIAARQVNDIYGGINWEAMGRDKTFQDILRATILAPDWAQTNINLAKNIGKSVWNFNSKEGQIYRRMAGNLVLAYTTANLTNKLLSGHWMHENDPGQTFSIEAGYTADGKKRYIRPFGTAADFVRIPFDVMASTLKGDASSVWRVVQNRLSTPVSFVMRGFSDTDYRGRPIGYRGTDQYGNEMPLQQRVGGIANEVAGLFVPNPVRAAVDGATGRSNPEEAITGMLELPTRYTGGANSKTQQMVAGIAKQEGVQGQDLYQLNQEVRGMKLGGNQKAFIQQEGLAGLRSILKAKEMATPEEIEGQGATVTGNTFYVLNDSGQVQKIDVDKINAMPERNEVDAILKRKERFSAAKKLMDSQASPEVLEQGLQKLGISAEDAAYYYYASADTEVKDAYVGMQLESFATKNDRTGFLQFLANGRRLVNNQKMVSNARLDDLYKQGILSDAERDQLKELEYDSKGAKVKLTGRGRSAKLKKITVPKFDAPQVRRLQIKKSTSKAQLDRVKL